MAAKQEKQKFKSDLFEFIRSRCSEVTVKHKGKIPFNDAEGIVAEVIDIFQKTGDVPRQITAACQFALVIIVPPYREYAYFIPICPMPWPFRLIFGVMYVWSVIIYNFSNKVKKAEKFEEVLIKGLDKAIDEIWSECGEKLAFRR